MRRHALLDHFLLPLIYCPVRLRQLPGKHLNDGEIMQVRDLRFVTFLLAGAAAFGLASAAVSQAPNRGAIAANAMANWGQFGPELTPVSNGASFAAGAITGTVAGSGSTFTMLTGATYNADFLAADNVLALFDTGSGNPAAGSFVLTFTTPVFAAGAQVQASSFGSFAGTVAAYNTGGTLLGSFAVNGSNGGNGNGTAAFAGIISDALDIKRLEFFGFGAGAGINQLSLRNVAQPIPEPGAAALMLAGLLGIATLRRRQLRA
jgi:hypothetical protein